MNFILRVRASELQGQQIEAPGLPALPLPVDAHRWVLANNRFTDVCVFPRISSVDEKTFVFTHGCGVWV
jgi:hypothetical protein